MQISRYLFVSLIIGAALFCAGCTQPAFPVTVPTATPIAKVIDPAQMGLTPSDLPQGFTLAESRTKNPSDMGSVAMDLGWQGGQVFRYSSPAQDGKGGYEIVHAIAIYPARSIPDVITLADQQDRSISDFTYTDFTVLGLGEHARAFSGKAGTQIPTKTSVSNPLIAGMVTQETGTGVNTDFSEIIFSKGSTFEVLKISGPSPDTALLANLSKIAYAKIS